MSKIQGSCLCGGVRLAADGIDGPGSSCHCRMCQKAHGGPFGPYVTLNGLRWTEGEDLITVYPSSEHCTRSFCSRCGATLEFHDTRKPHLRAIALSVLDGDHGGRIGSHIFVDDKADWYDILDDLPRHAQGG